MLVNREEVRRLRENLPANVIDLAEKIGVTPQTLHRIERTGKARWGNIKKLAAVFEVDLKQIVKTSDDSTTFR